MLETENVLENRARARIGSTLKGKYRLERLLGVGGMASVYEAVHRNGKRFAVKLLHSEVSIHEDIRTRFLREGYVANKVEHPGAVTVIDDDIADDGAAFLVMELLEGEPVDAFVVRQGGRLPLRAVLCIADQLLDVLAAANAQQIVHRDIKPANIFLTREGQLKVLDFGVARWRGEAAGGFTTNTGIALGTPAFMAPEQALGRAAEIDGQSDVFAVGATLFALLSGHAVHDAQSAQEQMVLAATKPPKSLGEADPDSPTSVVAIVDKALAFAKKDRWANAATMRDAIRVAHAELYAAEPAVATLASMVSQVRVSVAPDTSPSDPMAPTALAEAVDVARVPSPSPSPSPSAPLASSLVGTAARVTATPGSRWVRVGLLASLLVALGVVAGTMLSRRADEVPSAASGQSAGTTTPTATANPTSTATANPTATSTSNPASTSTESASDAARAFVPPPRASAKPSSAPRDSFDRQ